MHAHTHTHTHAYMHPCTLTQMHAYTHTDTHTQPTYTTCTHAHTHAQSTVMTGFISRDVPNQWQLTHLDPSFGGVGGNPTFFLLQSGGLPKTVGLFVGVQGPYLKMDRQYFQQTEGSQYCTGSLCVMQPG